MNAWTFLYRLKNDIQIGTVGAHLYRQLPRITVASTDMVKEMLPIVTDEVPLMTEETKINISPSSFAMMAIAKCETEVGANVCNSNHRIGQTV